MRDLDINTKRRLFKIRNKENVGMKKFRVMVSASVDYEIEAKNEEEAEMTAKETWFSKMQFMGSEHISLYEIDKD